MELSKVDNWDVWNSSLYYYILVLQVVSYLLRGCVFLSLGASVLDRLSAVAIRIVWSD